MGKPRDGAWRPTGKRRRRGHRRAMADRRDGDGAPSQRFAARSRIATAISRTTALAWQASPFYVVFLVASTAVTAAIAPVSLWLGKVLVDEVASGDVRRVVIFGVVAGVAAVTGISGIMAVITANRVEAFSDRVAYVAEQRLL